MSKIRFAVVGCGHIGKRHASIIKANSDFELVALCDIRSKYDLGLEQFGDFSFFNNIDTCLLYTSPSPRDRQKSRMPSSA